MHDFTFVNGYQVPGDRVVALGIRQLNFGGNNTRTTIEGMGPYMSLTSTHNPTGRRNLKHLTNLDSTDPMLCVIFFNSLTNY